MGLSGADSTHGDIDSTTGADKDKEMVLVCFVVPDNYSKLQAALFSNTLELCPVALFDFSVSFTFPVTSYLPDALLHGTSSGIRTNQPKQKEFKDEDVTINAYLMSNC